MDIETKTRLQAQIKTMKNSLALLDKHVSGNNWESVALDLEEIGMASIEARVILQGTKHG